MSAAPRRAADGADPPGEDVADLLAQALARLGVPDAGRDDVAEIAASLAARTAGYASTVEAVIGDAFFEEDASEPVLVRDIPFTSLCRRHLMLFSGRAHVAYLPGERVVGLSRLARVVDLYARRLQTQTALTDQVAHGLERVLDARGVGVWMEARHTCPGSAGVTFTRCVLGDLRLPVWQDWLGTQVGRGQLVR